MTSLRFLQILFTFVFLEKCSSFVTENTKIIFAENLNIKKPIKLYENIAHLQIQGLKETLYFETFSQLFNVSNLKIFNNQIRKIEKGAICSSPSLKSLELNFAGNAYAPTLTKQSFTLCKFQLQELFLRFDFDNPSKLEVDALEDLKLKSFGLQCYWIGSLHRKFLHLHHQSLVSLVLSNCYIYDIKEDFFNDMINLESLEISHNRNLTYLPRNLFKKNLKLKNLSLKNNRLREISWNIFDNLKDMEFLDLSGNRLAHFDAEQIASFMPSLKKLLILKNLVPCKLKEAFAEDLENKLKNSVKVVYTNKQYKLEIENL